MRGVNMEWDFENELIIPNESIRVNLLKVIELYGLKIETISLISDIDCKWLIKYINGENLDIGIKFKDYLFLSDLALYISESFKIDYDEKLILLIKYFNEFFKIDYDILANIAKISVAELETFMDFPNTLAIDKKYKLGMTVMTLNLIFKRPEYKRVENNF